MHTVRGPSCDLGFVGSESGDGAPLADSLSLFWLYALSDSVSPRESVLTASSDPTDPWPTYRDRPHRESK